MARARATGPGAIPPALADESYERLLAFRTALRRYFRWAEQRAEEVGITPAQHQLLLAIRGRPEPQEPTIGDLAAELLIRHHSVVELVDRAEAAGLVRRRVDDVDLRVVRVQLTTKGRQCVRWLAAQHMQELARMAPAIRPILDQFGA